MVEVLLNFFYTPPIYDNFMICKSCDKIFDRFFVEVQKSRFWYNKYCNISPTTHEHITKVCGIDSSHLELSIPVISLCFNEWLVRGVGNRCQKGLFWPVFGSKKFIISTNYELFENKELHIQSHQTSCCHNFQVTWLGWWHRRNTVLMRCCCFHIVSQIIWCAWASVS